MLKSVRKTRPPLLTELFDILEQLPTAGIPNHPPSVPVLPWFCAALVRAAGAPCGRDAGGFYVHVVRVATAGRFADRSRGLRHADSPGRAAYKTVRGKETSQSRGVSFNRGASWK